MTIETDSCEDGATERTFQSRSDETPSETVLRAVAAVSGRSALASTEAEGHPLEPLYESIDPDALDALFRARGNDPTAAGRVEFGYCGYHVTVERSRAVTVREC